ncbi:MAG: hypothetical protein Q7V62_14325, partial [Actinomycetota bacterium]|nr:hypothetical protein [Actinomycetota bacterium]
MALSPEDQAFVEDRLATMRRQRKALEYYVHELEAANPAFPFVRRTYATHEPNLAHRFIRSKAG